MERSIKILALIVVSIFLLAGCRADDPLAASAPRVESHIEEASHLGTEINAEDDVLRFSEANAMMVEDDTLLIENIAPYSGICLENETEETVSDVYAFRITNLGSQTIQNADLVFATDEQELLFCVEMLPVGQTTTVVETRKTAATEQSVYYVESSITYLDSSLENTTCIEVVGSGGGSVTVKNATEELLPLVRVFYRNTDEDGNLLGGKCFSFVADGLEPGAEAAVEAENWTENSQIATVLLVQE